MDYFISVITQDEITEGIVEAASISGGQFLTESDDSFVVGETTDGNNVVRIPLSSGLSQDDSDRLAESMAEHLFEMGYEDFDIEISAGEDADYDPVEDIQVFMQNDPMYYRRVYLPAVLAVKDSIQANDRRDVKAMLSSAVNKAISAYCTKFDVGPANSVFTPERRAELSSKVYERELENIRNGEYD